MKNQKDQKWLTKEEREEEFPYQYEDVDPESMKVKKISEKPKLQKIFDDVISIHTKFVLDKKQSEIRFGNNSIFYYSGHSLRRGIPPYVDLVIIEVWENQVEVKHPNGTILRIPDIDLIKEMSDNGLDVSKWLPEKPAAQ